MGKGHSIYVQCFVAGALVGNVMMGGIRLKACQCLMPDILDEVRAYLAVSTQGIPFGFIGGHKSSAVCHDKGHTGEPLHLEVETLTASHGHCNS